MARDETVAVLGAGGTMGLPMARNLARAGFGVRAWNRTRAKAEPLREDGATVWDSPAEAAEGATVLLTMLSDGDAAIDAVDGPRGAFSRVGEDVLWLQMSTIGETATARCIELAQRAGVGFLDAPVLGTKQPAEAGELVVLASGAQELRERAAPLFGVLGKRTQWLGEAGRGTLLKLVVNSWIVAVVEGGAETLALAEEAARRRGLDLPVVEAIRRRLDEGVPAHGDEDLAATYLASAPQRTRS